VLGEQRDLLPDLLRHLSATYSNSIRGLSSLTLDTVVLGPRQDGEMSDLEDLFDRLLIGWSVVEYDGRRYGVTRSVLAGGRSEKVVAEALDGSDLVSANLYRLDGRPVLKPCEMSTEKVLDFLRGLET
jgi:hypothetical protein